jgi:hypothetical protein
MVLYDDTDSTYEELLTKSKLPTLKIRRIRTIAIETFKIVNKTSPLYLQTFCDRCVFVSVLFFRCVKCAGT